MSAIAATIPTVGADAAVRHTALYVGTVRHRRFDAVPHEFALRVWFAYLDLDELEQAFDRRWFWSARRIAPMRFRRRDYFGPPDQPLADAVRDAVQQQLSVRPTGPVRLLTNLRCFGYLFNPVSFYYCFDRDGALAAVLAEITNTPWGERHHYVVDARGGGTTRAVFEKRFHVSPFQPMEQVYHWALSPPGERLVVHMENRRGEQCVFDATLTAERRPWTGRNLALQLLRRPLMTWRVIAGIYWHALVLWWKRAPFHAHPSKRSEA